MTEKLSKHLGNVSHKETHDQEYIYEFDFKGKIQRWKWYGRLDKSGNRILNNFHDYTTDTYLAINAQQMIVNGYSHILLSGYENTEMKRVKEV